MHGYGERLEAQPDGFATASELFMLVRPSAEREREEYNASLRFMKGWKEVFSPVVVIITNKQGWGRYF